MPHLIQCDNLTTAHIADILKQANAFKFRSYKDQRPLKNHNIICAFFENSTRTLSSFEIAAHNLGANVIKLDVSKSSTSKGEDLKDTILNLGAMDPSAIIIRHQFSGTCNYLQKYVSFALINAGDGAYAHPSQALLDLLTIYNHFNDAKDPDYEAGLLRLRGKKIGIIGDVKNSRVANSNIILLKKLGFEITLIAPPHFLPQPKVLEKMGLNFSYDLESSLKNLDIVMSLRVQIERHNYQIYGSLEDYSLDFCLTIPKLQDLDLLILHPGPVNKDIDIASNVIDDSRSAVLTQVNNGVFVRMAIILFCIGKKC